MEFIKTGERYSALWDLVIPVRGKYLDRMGEVVAIYRDHCLFAAFGEGGIGWHISYEFPGKVIGAFPLADITFGFESPCIMEAGYDSVQEN